MNFNKHFSLQVNGIVRVTNLRHYNVALFLLEMGSFTNLVMCIYVLMIHRIKLAHTLEIDCVLTRNCHFCFKESRKVNVRLEVRFLLDRPIHSLYTVSQKKLYPLGRSA